MRVRFSLGAVAVCVILVTVAGCTTPTDDVSPDGDGDVDSDADAREIHLGIEDSGSCFEVEEGARAVIRLSENPSTGYGWNITEKEGLRIQNSTYVAPENETKLGAPGTRHVESVVEETGSLRMKYVRGFEDGEPEEVFEVSFAVDEKCPVGSSV